MVREVRALGMESCATSACSSPTRPSSSRTPASTTTTTTSTPPREYYGEIITTRTFQDRLDTLAAVRDAGMKVCCGGIVGMGESRATAPACCARWRACPQHPESVPINQLVQVPGTPLHGIAPVDPFDFVRTIAVARIAACPRAHVRLSAGRSQMSDEMQALCFFAGANSIFYGEKLLTTGNPDVERTANCCAPGAHRKPPAAGACRNHRRKQRGA